MKSTFFVKVIIQSLFFDQKIKRIKLFIFLKFLEKKKKENFYIFFNIYNTIISLIKNSRKKKYDEGRWYINEYY